MDALHAEGVVVSCRAGNVRVSPHCYNTSGDVDAALAAFANTATCCGVRFDHVQQGCPRCNRHAALML